MTLKKTLAKFMSKCNNCGREIWPDDVAYFDIEHRKMICSSCGVAEPNVTSIPPVAVVKKDTESSTPPTYSPSPKEQNIAKAHDENMVANQQLVLQLSTLSKAIIDLTTVEADRNKLLKERGA